MTHFPLLTEGYRQSVLPLVHDFFRYPVDYLDQSWVSDNSLLEQVNRLMEKNGYREPLSDWILSHFQLTRKVDCDFSEPYSRLALLHTPSLYRLLELAGVLVYSARVPHDMDDIGMDKELYQFAISKAPFLSRKAPEYCMSKLINDWSNQKLVRSALLCGGLNLMAIALTDVPESVTGRIALKLPKDLGIRWQTALGKRNKPDERIEDARRLVLKLYREVDPLCSLL
ncbi:MAG: SctK family type III secretion system sorting platform protein [Reinekea sp.]|jgi:type III secretion protein K